MTKQQSWILTDLDAHTIDFEPFKYDFTNLTLFRSVDYQRPFVMHSLHRQTITKLGTGLSSSCYFRIVKEELLMGRSLDFAELSGGLDLQSALIYDAVHLLAVSLGHLRDIQRIEPYSINCGTDGELPQSWQHGSSILNFMRVSRIPGLSR